MSPPGLPNEIMHMIFELVIGSEVFLYCDNSHRPPWDKSSLRLVCKLANEFVLSRNPLRWRGHCSSSYERMANPVYDWFVIENGQLPRLSKEKSAEPRNQMAITDWSHIPIHKLQTRHDEFELSWCTDDRSDAILIKPELEKFPKVSIILATYWALEDTDMQLMGMPEKAIVFSYNTTTKIVYYCWGKLRNQFKQSNGLPELAVAIHIVRSEKWIASDQEWTELYPEDEARNEGEALTEAGRLWCQSCYDFNEIEAALEENPESTSECDVVYSRQDMVGMALQLDR